ncbi:hypothetical protein MCQ_01126 [Candidatus Bartonella washoeensis Sb944nv]|uniref:Uncharacterized protein n=1 Tax=Candidatus Bartonella washoeensis Sb944nv TaxID=1094563 RepID=J1J3Q4_9HYPH|nr:hypothetical protein [Bartonella washoeensis]EJF78747.1 hypothetical protein MCQ_01126 [Bartonella washoeensis Sb944nv]
MKVIRKMPTEHERVSETSTDVTPVLQGGKLEREVRKNNKKNIVSPLL